ncbi:MAG: hypothetical protein AAFP26_01090 [Planctomycetota bacterium]
MIEKLYRPRSHSRKLRRRFHRWGAPAISVDMPDPDRTTPATAVMAADASGGGNGAAVARLQARLAQKDETIANQRDEIERRGERMEKLRDTIDRLKGRRGGGN